MAAWVLPAIQLAMAAAQAGGSIYSARKNAKAARATARGQRRDIRAASAIQQNRLLQEQRAGGVTGGMAAGQQGSMSRGFINQIGDVNRARDAQVGQINTNVWTQAPAQALSGIAGAVGSYKGATAALAQKAAKDNFANFLQSGTGTPEEFMKLAIAAGWPSPLAAMMARDPEKWRMLMGSGGGSTLTQPPTYRLPKMGNY